MSDTSVIRSVPDPDTAWCWLDQNGDTVSRLEIDRHTRKLEPQPAVAISPENYTDITTGDPYMVEGFTFTIAGDKLTVSEPDGTCWVWILEPAVWGDEPGYFIGRWRD